MVISWTPMSSVSLKRMALYCGVAVFVCMHTTAYKLLGLPEVQLPDVNLMREKVASQLPDVNLMREKVASQLPDVNLMRQKVASQLPDVNLMRQKVASQLPDVKVLQEETTVDANANLMRDKVTRHYAAANLIRAKETGQIVVPHLTLIPHKGSGPTPGGYTLLRHKLPGPIPEGYALREKVQTPSGYFIQGKGAGQLPDVYAIRASMNKGGADFLRTATAAVDEQDNPLSDVRQHVTKLHVEFFKPNNNDDDATRPNNDDDDATRPNNNDDDATRPNNDDDDPTRPNNDDENIETSENENAHSTGGLPDVPNQDSEGSGTLKPSGTGGSLRSSGSPKGSFIRCMTDKLLCKFGIVPKSNVPISNATESNVPKSSVAGPPEEMEDKTVTTFTSSESVKFNIFPIKPHTPHTPHTGSGPMPTQDMTLEVRSTGPSGFGTSVGQLGTSEAEIGTSGKLVPSSEHFLKKQLTTVTYDILMILLRQNPELAYLVVVNSMPCPSCGGNHRIHQLVQEFQHRRYFKMVVLSEPSSAILEQLLSSKRTNGLLLFPAGGLSHGRSFYQVATEQDTGELVQFINTHARIPPHEMNK